MATTLSCPFINTDVCVCVCPLSSYTRRNFILLLDILALATMNAHSHVLNICLELFQINKNERLPNYNYNCFTLFKFTINCELLGFIFYLHLTLYWP